MPAYCTIAEVRAAGITDPPHDDAAVTAAIAEWSQWVDDTTGQWFESRVLAAASALRLDGTGHRHLFLPAPVVSVSEIRRMQRTADPDTSTVVDADTYVVYNRTAAAGGRDDRPNPKITLVDVTQTHHHFQPRLVARTPEWFEGEQNYEVDGTFGWLDPGGTTPRAIARAVCLLVVHNITPAGEYDDLASRRSGDLRSLTVQGRSATWGGPTSGATLSGIPEVDRLLAQFMGPLHMEAA